MEAAGGKGSAPYRGDPHEVDIAVDRADPDGPADSLLSFCIPPAFSGYGQDRGTASGLSPGQDLIRRHHYSASGALSYPGIIRASLSCL